MTGSRPADDNFIREQRFSSALQQLLGYRLVEWAPDHAVFEYEVAPAHLNRTNRLHGGILAVLCDTAAGYAGCYCAIPGETRSSIIRVWQCEQRRRSVVVKDCGDEGTMLPLHWAEEHYRSPCRRQLPGGRRWSQSCPTHQREAGQY